MADIDMRYATDEDWERLEEKELKPVPLGVGGSIFMIGIFVLIGAFLWATYHFR